MNKTSKIKPKVDSAALVKAFVRRKHDIMRPDMSVLPINSPGWSRLSADLDHALAPATLVSLIRREDIYDALIADKSSFNVPYGSSPRRGHRIGRRAKPLYERGSISLETFGPNNSRASQQNRKVRGILRRKAELVLRSAKRTRATVAVSEISPRGSPNIEAAAVEPASSKRRNNIISEEKKPPLNFCDFAHQPKVCLERITFNQKKTGRPLRLDRNIVISEILARKDDIFGPGGSCVGPTDYIWGEIANSLGKKISPCTIYRIARQKQVRDEIKDSEKTNVVDTWQEMNEKRFNVMRDVITNALLKHRAEILQRNGTYVSRENSVWFRVAKDVGMSDISATTVYDVAQRPEVRERIKNVAISANSDDSQKRRKLNRKIVADAIVARKDEIVNAEGRYESKAHPVWLRIANDLGNGSTPGTIYTLACRKDVRARVLLPDQKNNIPQLAVNGQAEDSATASDTTSIRHEINEMVFEDAIRKHLKDFDTFDALNKEFKELIKDLRERETNIFDVKALSNEIKELRRDLREREGNKFTIKALFNEINELRRELRERDEIHFGTECRPILIN